jgi:hypothetical protein
VHDIKILPSNRGISIFSGDDGIVSDVHIYNIDCETRIFAGGWWGKGEGFVICSSNTTGKIENVLIENSKFIEENPSLVSGAKNVTLRNCALEYKKGNTHPYFYGKMDLQPNHPKLLNAPFAIGDTLYVEECDSLVRE